MEWTRGRTIGQGSSATVSMATLLSSGDVLAVKSAEFYRSNALRREQQILSSLSSPYIVRYRGYDVSTENNKLMYNLFMDFSPDGTLCDEIQRHGGRLGENTIVHYTRHILLGLEYLHSRGIVHCDIKGRNILVGDDGGARIADFGCGRLPGEEAAPIGGSPAYMAPEVARGEEQGSPADVWALGCTVIEMATGQSPWVSGSGCTDPVSLLYRIGFAGESPELPCSLSKHGRDFLEKCLKREPEDRWTAKQLLNHPFLSEPSTSPDRIQNLKFSNSPTSILDLGLWTETEPESPRDWTGEESSVVDRIEGLSCSSAAEWLLDEEWITVREDVGGDRGSVGGTVEELESVVGGQKWDLLGGDIGFGCCVGTNSRTTSTHQFNFLHVRHKFKLIPLFS